MLDPSYSVLLGDPECENSKNTKESILAVAIAVPVTVVFVTIAAFAFIYFARKMKIWKRVRSEQKIHEMDGLKFTRWKALK